jgi:hypothetical protein
MFAMQIRSLRASSRFKWSVFRGRCRRNLLVGLVVFVLAGLYGTWAAHRFAARSDDTHAFDRALTQLAQPMVRQPAQLRTIEPRNITELYLMSIISDQRNALAGITVLMLRCIFALTAAGLGLVLLTAGATEWEVRSEVD